MLPAAELSLRGRRGQHGLPAALPVGHGGTLRAHLRLRGAPDAPDVPHAHLPVRRAVSAVFFSACGARPGAAGLRGGAWLGRARRHLGADHRPGDHCRGVAIDGAGAPRAALQLQAGGLRHADNLCAVPAGGGGCDHHAAGVAHTPHVRLQLPAHQHLESRRPHAGRAAAPYHAPGCRHLGGVDCPADPRQLRDEPAAELG